MIAIGRADRSAVAHTRQELERVGLEPLPAAAPVPVPPARQLALDERRG